MRKIIIYGSYYNTCKKYAEKLGQMTNIPVISYEEIKDINEYDYIIYLGALYAGGMLGLSKTFKKIKNIDNKNIIIVSVGLADPKDSETCINIRNNIKKQINLAIYNKAKIFHLRGGIDYAKLKFSHKILMKLLYNNIKKIPLNKQSAENLAMIETYNKKVDFIDFNSLNQIIENI